MAVAAISGLRDLIMSPNAAVNVAVHTGTRLALGRSRVMGMSDYASEVLGWHASAVPPNKGDLKELAAKERAEKRQIYFNSIVWTHRGQCGPKLSSPSLDRKTDDKILTLENTHIICFQCNVGKNSDTTEGYIQHCRDVAARHPAPL